MRGSVRCGQVALSAFQDVQAKHEELLRLETSIRELHQVLPGVACVKRATAGAVKTLGEKTVLLLAVGCSEMRWCRRAASGGGWRAATRCSGPALGPRAAALKQARS